MMVKWNEVFSTGRMGVNAVRNFVEGKLNCEQVQVMFRNRYPEASSELRRVIRNRGTKDARTLDKKALRRRNLV